MNYKVSIVRESPYFGTEIVDFNFILNFWYKFNSYK